MFAAPDGEENTEYDPILVHLFLGLPQPGRQWLRSEDRGHRSFGAGKPGKLWVFLDDLNGFSMI